MFCELHVRMVERLSQSSCSQREMLGLDRAANPRQVSQETASCLQRSQVCCVVTRTILLKVSFSSEFTLINVFILNSKQQRFWEMCHILELRVKKRK